MEHNGTLTQFCIAALIGTMECWLDGTIDKTLEDLAAFADTMIRNLLAGEKLQYRLIPTSQNGVPIFSVIYEKEHTL